MWILSRCAALLCFTLLGGIACPNASAAPSSYPLGNPVLSIPPFERLEYSVEFGIIKAGTATIEVVPPDSTSHETIEFVSRARSSPLFSSFYPVDDIVRSVVDRETFLPIRFEKRISEGSYRVEETLFFDRDANVSISARGDTVPIPPLARDVLSAFFDVRRHELIPGHSLTFANHAGKKTAVIEVRVLGRETLSTRVGRFRCIKVQPVLARGGLFKNEGRIWVWFTDDDRRIPVRMESKLAFGSIVAHLERVTRPGVQLSARSERRARR